MKYLSKVLLLCCGLIFCVKSHAQSPPVLFDSTTTFIDYFNQLELQLDPSDTGEGQSHSKFGFLKQYWMDRAVKNDARADSATNTNMFSQYFRELLGAVAAKQSAGCVTDKFSGNWRCIGPDTLPTQALGKVDDLWSDPADSLHILAATVGGLFETKNGGRVWKCITDNAVIPYGIQVLRLA